MAQYQVQAPDGSTITLEGPEGASDEQILAQAKRLWQQQQSPVNVPKARPFRSLTPLEPQMETGALSALNTLTFGIPEYLASKTQAGRDYIESARREYPGATSVGNLAGMINPVGVGAQLGWKGVGKLHKKLVEDPAILKMIPGNKKLQKAYDSLLAAQKTGNAKKIAAAEQLFDDLSKPLVEKAENIIGKSIKNAAKLGGGVAGAQLAGGATSGIQNENLAEGIATARAIGEVPEQVLRSVGVPINTNIEEVVPAGMAGIAELLRSILGSNEMSEEEQQQIRTQLELLGPDAIR